MASNGRSCISRTAAFRARTCCWARVDSRSRSRASTWSAWDLLLESTRAQQHVLARNAAVLEIQLHSARERAAGRGWIQEADLGLQRGAPGQCLARAGAGPACLQPGARARTGTPPVRTREIGRAHV